MTPRVELKIARIFWTTFALLAVGLALASLYLGEDYYSLPRMGRHHAAEHKTLGPGGSYGHLLGIGGSLLMVSNLLYLVRRRWSRVEGLGDLSSWLAFHVALGVAGVALVFVHAAMLYDNPIARASLIAAGVVLVTGVVGRWIYAQVPHRPDGHEQDEGELVSRLRGRLTSIRTELRTAVEDVEQALTRLVAPPVSGPLAAAGRAVLAPVTYLRVLARAAAWRRRLAQAPYGLSRAEIDQVLAVAGEVTVLRRAFRRQTAFKQVVGAWRGVHRIATFILLLTLVTHVVTVLYFSVG
jgi:hypothetical protein